VAAINYYLEIVAEEGTRRGYHLNIAKISCGLHPPQITVTDAQLQFERMHLQKKLQQRDSSRIALLMQTEIAELHPLFVMIPGPVEPWEKI
jgi:hypothetical protein